MKKILIVGGAGFIGHNLALDFISRGFKVHVTDGLEVNNLTSIIGNYDNIPYPNLSKKIIFERLSLLEKNGVELTVQDARDYHAVSKLITKYNPDILIHLAAVSHSNRSNKNPYNTFDHSLRTLENTLDATRDNIGHYIFFSSSMVYGNFKHQDVNEKYHCEPLGIYGALKYAAERIIISYNQVFNTPYTIIRPSALYGERCVSRRVGQVFIENALHNESLKISGTGKEKLDFTYINDLIHGVNLIIENEKSKNNIFNITFGNARTVLELVEILKNYFKNLKVEFRDKENLVPDRGTLSIKKAKELLGYNPSWAVDKGYAKYIEWYLDFYKNKI